MEASTIDPNILDAAVKYVSGILVQHPKLWLCLIFALVLRGVLSAVLKAYVARTKIAGKTVAGWVTKAQDVLSWNPLPGKYGLLYFWNLPGVPSFGGKEVKSTMIMPPPPPLPPPPEDSGQFKTPGGGAA